MDELLGLLNHNGNKVLCYANDLVVLVQRVHYSVVRDDMQQDLNVISSWTSKFPRKIERGSWSTMRVQKFTYSVNTYPYTKYNPIPQYARNKFLQKHFNPPFSIRYIEFVNTNKYK